ncbi:MAG TPA: nuclear transport factor 2 family protein [Blastocatellia bacterium]|nr:nuclear transport factor 2 family protein [Blastocatellia bacterium]
MRKLNRLLVTVLALFIISLTPALAQDSEEAAIRETIQHYFQGHATGNGEHFRKAFHPDAKLFFIRDGKLTQWTSEEYIARASGKPAADEAQRKRRVDSIDVSGNAAVVKVTLDYPSVVFTDYMSMLKVDGQWKIINKTFYAKPRS